MTIVRPTALHWRFVPDEFVALAYQLLLTRSPCLQRLALAAAGHSLDVQAYPFEAAALGSAVLYGPKVRNFLPSYGRLATAGAARIVNDAGALGNAVSRLIAPDQAATMAHAGWDVISEGAELADRVIEMVQDRLDEEMGASDARA